MSKTYRGKKGDLHSKRKTISILQDKKNVQKVFDIFAIRYKDRLGGYTRIVKIGNRFGDNAPTAIIELVDRDEKIKGQEVELRHILIAPKVSNEALNQAKVDVEIIREKIIFLSMQIKQFLTRVVVQLF